MLITTHPEGADLPVIKHYFAYGSNMNKERMRARGVQFSEMFVGFLPNMQLRFNKLCKNTGTGHANIVYCRESIVEGVVYHLESSDDLNTLDRFETTPKYYSREIIPVKSPGNHAGDGIAAWVYIANRAVLCEGLLPERWYLNHLLAGEPYLTPRYFQSLQQTRCIEFNPEGRPLYL